MINFVRNHSFAFQVSFILIVLALMIVFLRYSLGVVDVFLAETRSASPGEKLQAVTGFLGSLVGALLAGGFAIIAGAWVYGLERSERLRRENDVAQKNALEIAATAKMLAFWISAQFSSILTTLDVIRNLAQTNNETPADAAMIMRIHSRDIVAVFPPSELRARLRDHYPLALIPLDKIIAQIEIYSNQISTTISSKTSPDGSRLDALNPSPLWAYGMIQAPKSFEWLLDEIAEFCPAIAQTCIKYRDATERRILAIEQWSRAQGVTGTDYSHLLQGLEKSQDLIQKRQK